MLGPFPQPPRRCEGSSSTSKTGQSRDRNHRYESGVFGNQIAHKREGHTRVMLHNTTSIGFCSTERSKETAKMEKLRKTVIKQEVDILALTELNKRWSAIEEENTIWTAMRRWRKQGRTYAAYNKLDPRKTKE